MATGERDSAVTGRRSGDRTRAAILAAARERFAADGYERATIRAIAADAAIDPAMVMRYFGSKEKLFAAAAEFDLRLPDFAALPRDELGTRLLEHFLDRWEAGDTLMALLRAAVTNESAAERLRQIFATQLTPAIAALLPPDTPNAATATDGADAGDAGTAGDAAEGGDAGNGTNAAGGAGEASAAPTAGVVDGARVGAEVRAGLVATQTMGLALCRYVLPLGPVASMPRATVVAWLAPTIQRYLTDDDPTAA